MLDNPLCSITIHQCIEKTHLDYKKKLPEISEDLMKYPYAEILNRWSAAEESDDGRGYNGRRTEVSVILEARTIPISKMKIMKNLF